MNTCIANKWDNLDEMDKFLEGYKWLNLIQGEIENSNNPTISSDWNSNPKHSHKEMLGQYGFAGEFHQLLKEKTKTKNKQTKKCFTNSSKNKEVGTLPNSFNETSITLIPKPDKGITRKLKTVSYEYKGKNPQQNTSKSNPVTYKTDHNKMGCIQVWKGSSTYKNQFM